MKIETKTLIADLQKRTQGVIADAKDLSQLSASALNAKPNEDCWSVLECLEHLNRYGDFYIPEINRVLNQAQKKQTAEFTSGLLGNKFAKMMLPGAKPMNTFKSMNPSLSSDLRKDILETFIAQQEAFLEILNRSSAYNLKKLKTSITISSMIKLRLGDTLRIVIYHNQRHMEQAKRAVSRARIDLESA